jgi:hypothetical protein
MTITTRSPSEHYTEAERLLATAESPTIDPGLRDLAAMLVIGHALLASAPRRARRRPEPPAPRHGGNSPTERWLRGDDE